MKRGFTLLELIIVIVILGVLATLGFAQYQRMVERARGAEARTILGYLRTAAASHRIEYGDVDGSTSSVTFTNTRAGIGTLADSVPSACRATHYFSYTVTSVAPAGFVATATRCLSSGKRPNLPGSTATDLILTTDFANGTDTWSGSGGY